jgi:hypothetical protein
LISEVRFMSERKEFLTAVEVMELLRLGRTTVYQQARLFLATGGTDGIPCRRYGRSLRFPATDVEAMVAGPHTVRPPAAKVVDLIGGRQSTPTPPPEPRSRSTRRRARTARRSSDDDQRSLPFAG